ncbi:heat shock 22 kDa protein, mitochondrial [Tanacetum coccineum]
MAFLNKKLLVFKLILNRSGAQLRPAVVPSYQFLNTTSVHPQGPAPRSLYERFSVKKLSRLFYRITHPVPSTVWVWPRSEETDECIHYYIAVPGMHDEDVKVSVENNSVCVVAEGDKIFEATHSFKKYICYIDLPDIDSTNKIYTTRGIKAEMEFNCGQVKLTIPKLRQEEKMFDVKVNHTFETYLDHQMSA